MAFHTWQSKKLDWYVWQPYFWYLSRFINLHPIVDVEQKCIKHCFMLSLSVEVWILQEAENSWASASDSSLICLILSIFCYLQTFDYLAAKCQEAARYLILEQSLWIWPLISPQYGSRYDQSSNNWGHSIKQEPIRFCVIILNCLQQINSKFTKY